MLSAQVIYWNQKDMACPIQYLPQVSRCEKIRKIALQAATAALCNGPSLAIEAYFDCPPDMVVAELNAKVGLSAYRHPGDSQRSRKRAFPASSHIQSDGNSTVQCAVMRKPGAE